MRTLPLLACLLGMTPASAQIRSVTLHEPARDFGYFIGDVFRAEAVIVTGPDAKLDETSLPPPGPVSTWVDLRHIEIVRDREADDDGRITIRSEYQTFYAAEDATRVQIPAYDVVFLQDGARVQAHVPAWTFIASPLRHALLAETDPNALKADHPFPGANLAATRTRLLISLAVALGAAFVLARRLLPAVFLRAKPFAMAQRRIKRLARAADDESQRAAMLELHRAFDATAGHRVLADDVAAFIARHERFGPIHTDIEAFFAASRQTFFGAATAARPEPVMWLASLGKRLARAEREA